MLVLRERERERERENGVHSLWDEASNDEEAHVSCKRLRLVSVDRVEPWVSQARETDLCRVSHYT